MPIFELSLDSSYLLGSFSLEMFLQMFLNFNYRNLATFKLHIYRPDKTMIIVFKLMNSTSTSIIEHTQ